MAGVFSKHRFQVWNSTQHPYKHNLAEFAYGNDSLPGVTNIEQAIDWLLAALYPQTMPSVATPADLPLGGVVTNTVATPAVFTLAGHLFKNTDLVKFSTTGTLPTGLSVGLSYYVKVVDANTFQVCSDKDLLLPVACTDVGVGAHSVAMKNNSYKVVLNDGDGKAASYRWEQREGEAVASWHKIYDMDWGQDSILAAVMDMTQEWYVAKYGKDDLDPAGSPLVGANAGQHVYGGLSPNTNLTLHANAGDGTGASTGYVQVDDNVRPTDDNLYDLGTILKRFYALYLSNSATVNTMTLATGSITDSTGAISFGNENLSTTGNVTGNTLTAITSALINSTLSLSSGSITDSTGAIAFGNENLSTTGDITGATLNATTQAVIDGTLTITSGSITDSTGSITFGTTGLVTTGTVQGGDATFTKVSVDNLALDVNTLSSTNVNGDIHLDPNGTGKVKLDASTDVSNDLTVLGTSLLDDVQVVNGTLTTTGVDQDLTFSPNGLGSIIVEKDVLPSSPNAKSLGNSTDLFKDLYLAGNIGDGSTTISQATLQSFRAANTGVATGHSLFWDGAKWVSSAPDTEVVHNTVSGLTTGDAGHTQFVMLQGRTGGQTVQGGTASTEHLVLESTSHATKGLVKTKDSLVPNTTAAYTSQWDGTDLGGSSNYFRDVYTKGEFKGLRVENVAVEPAFSPLNSGRLVFNTVDGKIKYDTGTQWKEVGSGTGGGGVNWITYGDAEAGTTTGWTVTANTSGTAEPDGTFTLFPATTWTVSSSSPLSGTNSYLATLNQAGEQIVYDFTIDDANKFRRQTIDFDYTIVSGTYASGDLSVWIYDVGNSTFIRDVSPKSIAAHGLPSAHMFCEFQTTGSTSYKLVIHSKISTGAVVKFDGFSIAPKNRSYTPNISDLISYPGSPVIGATTTAPTYTAYSGENQWKYSKNGDKAAISIFVGFTSVVSAGSGTYLFPMPSGLVIDSTKINVSTDPNIATNIGRMFIWDANSSSKKIGYVWAYNTTNLAAYVGNDSTSIASVTNSNAYISGSVRYSLEVPGVPIVGWSSNVVTVDAVPESSVVARVYKNGTQALNSATTTKFTGFTVDSDKTAMWNSSLNRFDIQYPGDFTLHTHGDIGSVANSLFVIGYDKNSSGSWTYMGGISQNGYRTGGSIIIPDLKKGDWIEVGGYCAVGGATLAAGWSTWIALEKIPSVAQIGWDKPINVEEVSTQTASGTFTVNWSSSLLHEVTISGNNTVSFAGSYNGQTCSLLVYNSAGSDYTLTFPTLIKQTAFTATVKAGKRNAYTFIKTSAGFYASCIEDMS